METKNTRPIFPWDMTQRLIFTKYKLSVQLSKHEGRYKKTVQGPACIRLKPRYKERLQTKYLKAQTNKVSLVSSCWRSETVSLDDFSNCSSVLSGAQRGVSPVIFHDTPNYTSPQKPRKRITKEHACFSKQMIQKQIRREYVAHVEEKLKQHPLAMYPHYKDHMTPELFDKVVSILDPDMCVNSASSLPTPTADHAEEEEEKNCTEPNEEDVNRAKHGPSANKSILQL